MSVPQFNCKLGIITISDGLLWGLDAFISVQYSEKYL